MRFFAASMLVLLLGCGSSTRGPASTETMFTPVSMRLHPIFTGVKDWTGDNKTDGIEAELEFVDQFGDPTKAAGQVIFELYEFREGGPDPRGLRLVNPWVADVGTLAEQRSRWNRTSRTYSFQLAIPTVRTGESYVLEATFKPTDGPRFFDQMILKKSSSRSPKRDAQERKREQPNTAPSTQPLERPAQP